MAYKDPETYRQYQKEYRERNGERLRAYRRQYGKEHPDTRRRDLREYQKGYYEAHREAVKAASHAWRLANPGWMADLNRRRDPRYRNVEYEFIDHFDIAARDGWVCHLCGEPIPRDVKAHHRLALTLDHLIPVSHGGSHTAVNVKAAHRGCNSRRGNLSLAEFFARHEDADAK